MGHDTIQPFFIKVARFVIAPYLNLFLNFVFTEGIFPSNCKVVSVVPVYKTGAKDDMNNYRPISILTCFSKIIEKILYARLYKFLKKHNVIYENQYGFQTNVSTVHAMLDVVTSFYDNINEFCYTALSFVELKAFDTVSHETLLTKPSNYGIRSVAYDLIHSYLHNRQQFVSNHLSKFDLKLTHCGVPKGSSLGPLFFLVYINDLNFALKKQPRLFADDTCFIVKGLNPKQLQIKINSELQNLHQWCCVNKLSINPSKTNIIIIPPKQTNTTIPHFHLTSNGSAINIVDRAKYLEVVIDNELNFKQHIKIMEGKVARSVGILSKLKHFFPQNIMLQLYYALVHPFLSYGIIFWEPLIPPTLKD